MVKAQRNAWKPTDRPQPNHAASRAEALDVRIAVSGELLDGGVEGVHASPAIKPIVDPHAFQPDVAALASLVLLHDGGGGELAIDEVDPRGGWPIREHRVTDYVVPVTLSP
jgi:hypothetical protein